MAPDLSQLISQLREHLSKNDDVTAPRHVLIFAGDSIWHSEVVNKILQGHESRSLWIGKSIDENITALIPASTFKKASQWLGGEKQVVVFDAGDDFDVDAFAAISGIVIGGGLFILLMPYEEKWNEVYSTHFGQRLLQSINNSSEITIIKQNDENINFHPNKSKTNIVHTIAAPFLTADQQSAVENIEEQVLKNTTNPIVLISDRGRGKSAALGISAARLVNAGIKNIAITAPRLRATDIIFKHIKELSPDAVSTRGRMQTGESTIQFYSPDQLLQEDINADVLLIDEAAGIPVPLLTSFLKKYPQCIYATTVHGYEGTGRGFALRFNKILNKHNPDWLKLHMETPIRWPVNDPLEKWMFSLLCLDAEIVETSSMNEIVTTNLKHQLLKKVEFVDNKALLNEVFALLVLAHYRTRPKDLKSLLDDEDLSLYVSLYNNHVVAVALVIEEGNFSDSLSTLVYRGERRPPGNLLAQALTYHCGVEHAATLDYARVMRIAVHPELQSQGIGSSLLNYLIKNEKQHGRDAIGTSFGMNEALLHFWKQLKFNVVRIGFTREKTSGEYAAIMLLPLSDKGEKVNQEAISRFNGQLSFWFDDILKDISIDVKNTFKLYKKMSLELTELDKKDLYSFARYSRNYELCISALTKLVLMNKNKIIQNDFPKNYQQVLNEKVTNKMSWKEIGNNLGLSGQNETRKLFHRAILYLMDHQSQ